MKVTDFVKQKDKEELFDLYSCLFDNFKDYKNISKSTMVKDIYELYNTDRFESLFTVRELKYLSNYTNKGLPIEEEHMWEIEMLICKLLAYTDGERIYLYDESEVLIKKLLKNINWEEKKESDCINELIVGYLKVSCNALKVMVINLFSQLLDVSLEKIEEHVNNNLCFKFYTFTYLEYVSSFDTDMEFIMFNPYYPIKDSVNNARIKKAVHGTVPSIDTLRSIFYNNYDVNNKKVREFFDMFFDIPSLVESFPIVNMSVLTNEEDLFTNWVNIYLGKNEELIKLWKKAFRVMPSAALNCYTPEENDKYLKKKVNKVIDIEKNYSKQVNANLSKKDANLFYKLYLGVLNFTNKKYNVVPNLKLDRVPDLNMEEFVEVSEKFYENKEKIIIQFCKENPLKFNNKELNLVKEFKRGIREDFTLVKFEEEYSVFLFNNHSYMVKGIVSNIDEIVSYKDLPRYVKTTLLPFKGNIVTDTLLVVMPINIGPNIAKSILKDYEKSEKIYKL